MIIYLAGAQNPVFLKTLIKAHVPNILMSFWQLKKNLKTAPLKIKQARDEGINVLLDSGAHSLYNEYHLMDGRAKDAKAQADRRFVKKRDAPRDELIKLTQAYMDEYIAFLREHGDLPTAFAELDIEGLVGLETVFKWRDQFADAGMKPIVTYHGSPEYEKIGGGAKGFIEDVIKRKLPYIGLAREGDPNFFTKFFGDFKSQLEANQIRVHLWGMTDVKTWSQIPGYSVDSTSWLNGSKYGTTHVWNPGTNKIHLYDHKVKEQTRLRFKEYCEQNEIDFEKFKADDMNEVNLFHACQWRDFAKHMEKDTTNAYWLSPLERAAVTEEARKENGVIPMMRPEVAVATRANIAKDLRQTVPRFCKTCYIKDRCPYFKEENQCVFPTSFEINSPGDFADIMRTVMELSSGRVAHALLIERMVGGYLDPNVSKELEKFMEMVEKFKEIMGPQKEKIVITAEGKQSGGILAQLLSGATPQK